MSHTLGPWSVEDPFEEELTIVQTELPTYRWRTIASIPLGDLEGGLPQEQVNANARLIAAAPDMLAALKLILAEAVPMGSESGNVTIERLAREAIAKAESKS